MAKSAPNALHRTRLSANATRLKNHPQYETLLLALIALTLIVFSTTAFWLSRDLRHQQAVVNRDVRHVGRTVDQLVHDVSHLYDRLDQWQPPVGGNDEQTAAPWEGTAGSLPVPPLPAGLDEKDTVLREPGSNETPAGAPTVMDFDDGEGARRLPATNWPDEWLK